MSSNDSTSDTSDNRGRRGNRSNSNTPGENQGAIKRRAVSDALDGKSGSGVGAIVMQAETISNTFNFNFG